MAIEVLIDRTAHPQHIMNRGTFQGRSASDFEESIFISEASFTVAFGDVQRNRLSRAKPLIACLAICATKYSGDLVRKRNVVDRKTINVESFMIESQCCHHAPFEYEYDCPALKLAPMAGMNELKAVHTPSEQHREFRSLVKYRKTFDNCINKMKRAIRAWFVNHGISIDKRDAAWHTEGD